MLQKPNINLFIVGAAKSGTTSLYNYLNQHPEVYFPKVKEPNFYSNIDSEDPMAYKHPKEGVFYHNKIIRNKEVYYSLYKNSANYKIIGDASPSYLWDIDSAKRIYTDFPQSKIIIMLRNPVFRTFSHYLMNIRSGVEKESDFLVALKRDKKTEPKVWGDGKVLLYEELGMYYNQVQTYFDLFNKKNIKVIIYEEFFQNTDKGLLEICEFLKIEKVTTINHTEVYNKYTSPKNKLSYFFIRNKGKLQYFRRFTPNALKKLFKNKILFKNTSKPKMSNSSKIYLQDIFSDNIKKLESLLNKNLDVWK